MSAWVYLGAHLIASLSFFGFFYGGVWSFAFPLITFVLIPLLDALFGPRAQNLNESELETLKSSRLYDLLLFSIVPLQYTLLITYLWRAMQLEWSAWEWVGCTLSLGISCGAYGINVAHELGHRRDEGSRWCAKALLLSTLYMHFFIEHNRGHHAKVATEEDPASARLNETVYAFWWRSVTGSFLSAWSLEARRLERKSISAWSWDNQALRFILIELIAICTIGLCAGIWALLGFIAASVIGFTLLEVINYIEHYGLQRARNNRGRYEPVTPAHSWNSNHLFSRAVLFELSRHADHHAHPRREYQILRHFPESYQLPTGYPGMILLALIPPLYIPIMSRQIDRESLRTHPSTSPELI